MKPEPRAPEQTPEEKEIDQKFPGRTMLNPAEVAAHLSISKQQVSDLIEGGELHAINIGGGLRKHWRIPVTALKRFVRENSSMNV